MYYTVELEQTVRGRVRIDSKGRTKAEVMEDLEKELVNTQYREFSRNQNAAGRG